MTVMTISETVTMLMSTMTMAVTTSRTSTKAMSRRRDVISMKSRSSAVEMIPAINPAIFKASPVGPATRWKSKKADPTVELDPGHGCASIPTNVSRSGMLLFELAPMPFTTTSASWC